MLLAMETGAKNCQLARQMHLNRGTVRAWRTRWGALSAKLEQLEAAGVADKGLTTVLVEGLTDTLRAGAPATFTAAQIDRLSVACENPAEAERPISPWTPREVADEVIQRGIVETISTRRVGLPQ